MTSQICKKVPKHQMGNVIAPNTSGKQKKLPRQRFKEDNPATIKYPHERSSVIKKQSGGVVDPKLMEYLQKKGYPQGPDTQPSLEQGRDKVKLTREQAKSMKIKNALSTAGTGLQDVGTGLLTMGTQLRKPTEEEYKAGRGSWRDRAPLVAGAVTAGVANELTAGGMGYLAGKIAQRGVGKAAQEATKTLTPKTMTASVSEVTPKSATPSWMKAGWVPNDSPTAGGLLDKSSIKSTPWSQDIGIEASAGVKPRINLDKNAMIDKVRRMQEERGVQNYNLVVSGAPEWGNQIRKPGQVTEVPWPEIQRPNVPGSARTIIKPGKFDYHHPQIVDVNGRRFHLKNQPSSPIYAPESMPNVIIRENEFAGQPLVSESNIHNVLSRLKKSNEGSFIRRSYINPDHAFLEKIPGEFEKEMPSITSELHQKHRAITPVHQSMLLTTVDPQTRQLANTNLQVQKTAPGKYLYQSHYNNLTNDAIEEAKEALEAGRKAGLRFDFNGSNNTLYDAATNKFSFIDMGVAPKSYNVNNPIQEFNKRLVNGIERNSPVSIRDFVRQKGLSALSYKEGGEINE